MRLVWRLLFVEMGKRSTKVLRKIDSCSFLIFITTDGVSAHVGVTGETLVALLKPRFEDCNLCLGRLNKAAEHYSVSTLNDHPWFCPLEPSVQEQVHYLTTSRDPLAMRGCIV